MLGLPGPGRALHRPLVTFPRRGLRRGRAGGVVRRGPYPRGGPEWLALFLTATIGGSPAWWMRQADIMVATGLDVLDAIAESRST
jgi:hypothetical protein